MSKSHSIYICQQCSTHSPTYLGKCPQCNSWNSFVETIEKGIGSRVSGTVKKAEIINLSQIEKTDYQRLDSGFGEFNRVLGGGIVMGSLVLVAGDPGIGKSTLLTQLAMNVNQSSDKTSLKADSSFVLYVAGEESAQQIKIRVDRIRPGASLAVLNETDVDRVIEAIRESQASWRLIIIDSIQTLETADLQSIAGSVGQVRECAHRLQAAAKELHIPILLVGHVTKEGNLAGPKTLEHLVDVVLSLEGDPASLFRVLRSSKNRFGPTDEVGIFEMQEKGMTEVQNPSQIFLDEKVDAPGSIVTATLNGQRPILVEIQALVTKSFLPVPRRVGSGIDNNRLQLLVAVLMKRLGLPLFDKDIFVNVTGGLKVSEPAADLGICLAIASSLKEKSVAPKTVIAGEVGLLGEVREVRGIEKRAAEAKKLGFIQIISSQNVKNLSQAVKLALISGN